MRATKEVAISLPHLMADYRPFPDHELKPPVRMPPEWWQSGSRDKLCEVYRGIQVKAVFVTIPGVPTTRHDARSNGGGGRANWLQSLKITAMPNAASFCFEHGLVADDSFGWTRLFDEGGELLDALIRMRRDKQLTHTPIILSAHGLGGIIVKRAIRLAHQQVSHSRGLLTSIAGVMFFGTPHSRTDLPLVWQNSAIILRYNSRIRNKDIITSDIASLLADACRCFETAFNEIPVLSAYETQETRVTGRVISNKFIVVGRESSKTNVKQEQLVGFDVDHPHICNMTSDYGGISAVCYFIESSLEAAQALPSQISDGGLATPTPLRISTLRGNLPRNVAGDPSTGSPGYIPLFTDIPSDREDPHLPCHLMPLARNKGFFGRKDILEDLETALLPNTNGVESEIVPTVLKSFAICGPGGIGKTQIAVEYIHSRKEYYDAVLWVQADELAKLAQGFYHIAIKLGLVKEDSADARDHVITREAVKSWLKEPVKSYAAGKVHEAELATWVLVFDNLDDLNILRDFWPSDSPGSVIITSRDPLSKTHSAGKGAAVNAFNSEEATDFLLKLTHREEEVEERSSGNIVAEKLGGLPLALTQMAGVIIRRDLSFSEFLEVYNEESSHKDLFNLHFPYASDGSGYQHTLASVWALETLNESTALLHILSLLDSDGIQERILEEGRGDNSLPLPGYPMTNAAYQVARTELQTRSLITRDRGTKKITMHRLIQDAARVKMSAERFDTVFRVTVTLLTSVWPFEEFEWRHGVSSRIECEDLFPHVLRLRKLAERRGPSTSISAADLEFPRLLKDAGWFSHERGNSQESQPFFTLALQDCESLKLRLSQMSTLNEKYEKLKHQLSLLLGEIHYNSGCIATETNRPSEALRHFKVLHQMMLEELGPDSCDIRLAISWNELGNGHMMNKQWETAVACFQKSIEIQKRHPDFEKTSLSFPLVNLGFAYWILGQLEKAEEICHEALLDRQKAYGIDDGKSFITGKLLHAFGNVRAAQGRMSESLDFHNRALLQYKKFTVGKNHHRTADVCIKVADHHVRLHQFQGARTLLDQALKIYGDREFYAPERARAKYKKGKLLTILGQQFTADIYFSEALALYRGLKPGDGRAIDDLNDEAFDDMITFWSR